MVEAVKLHFLSTSGQHLNVERLLALHAQYPTNFTYNNIVVMVGARLQRC